MAERELRIRITGDSREVVAAAKKAVEAVEGVGKAGKKGGKETKQAADEAATSMDQLAKKATVAAAAFAAFNKAKQFLLDSVAAAEENIAIQRQLRQTIKSTGMAAGLNVRELNAMADSLKKVSNFGDETITKAQAILLTFTNIGKDVFPKATETILDTAAALGGDLKENAIRLGKALNDPIKGVSALTEVGVSFTEQQVEMIKALSETGQVAEAQTIILKELGREFGGQARAQQSGIKRLEVAFNDLQVVVGKKLLPFLEAASEAVSDLIGGEGFAGISQTLKDVNYYMGGLTEAVAGVVAGFKFLGGVIKTVVVGSLAQMATRAADALDVVLAIPKAIAQAYRFIKQETGLGIFSVEQYDTFLAQTNNLQESARGLANGLSEQAAKAAESTFSMENLTRSYVGTLNAINGARQAHQDLANDLQGVKSSAEEAAIALEYYTRTVSAAEFTLAGGEAAIIRGDQVQVFGGKGLPVGGGPAFGAAGAPIEGARATGGAINRTGLYRLEKGEHVLSRNQTAAALGGSSPTIHQTVNFNLGGTNPRLREAARSLLPELQRATARGVAKGIA